MYVFLFFNLIKIFHVFHVKQSTFEQRTSGTFADYFKFRLKFSDMVFDLYVNENFIGFW